MTTVTLLTVVNLSVKCYIIGCNKTETEDTWRGRQRGEFTWRPTNKDSLPIDLIGDRQRRHRQFNRHSTKIATRKLDSATAPLLDDALYNVRECQLSRTLQRELLFIGFWQQQSNKVPLAVVVFKQSKSQWLRKYHISHEGVSGSYCALYFWLHFLRSVLKIEAELPTVPSSTFAKNLVVPSPEGYTPLHYIMKWQIQIGRLVWKLYRQTMSIPAKSQKCFERSRIFEIISSPLHFYEDSKPLLWGRFSWKVGLGESPDASFPEGRCITTKSYTYGNALLYLILVNTIVHWKHNLTPGS